MKQLKSIVVTVHEKRAHPYEHGHYDCSVTLTVETDTDLDSNESDEIIDSTRIAGRVHVTAECDEWEQAIRDENEYESVRVRIRNRLESLENNWGGKPARMTAEIKEDILRLPDNERGEWEDKLVDAVMKNIVARRNREVGDMSDGEIPF